MFECIGTVIGYKLLVSLQVLQLLDCGVTIFDELLPYFLPRSLFLLHLFHVCHESVISLNRFDQSSAFASHFATSNESFTEKPLFVALIDVIVGTSDVIQRVIHIQVGDRKRSANSTTNVSMTVVLEQASCMKFVMACRYRKSRTVVERALTYSADAVWVVAHLKKFKQIFQLSMGEYFMMVLLKGKKRKVVARFNPQSGFGGLKWGEFIGSKCGEELLELLRKLYCPEHHNWYVVSDYGYSNIPEVSDGEAIYTRCFTDKSVGDFALNTDIRAEGLEQKWTTTDMIDLQDRLRQDLDLHLHRQPTHVPHIHVRNLRKRNVSYVY